MKDLSVRLSYLVDIIADKKQNNFAKKVGIPAGTLNRYITGEVKNPPIDKIVKISKATGYTIQWLATGKGPMFLDAADKKELIIHERAGPYTSHGAEIEAMIKIVVEIMKSDNKTVKEALKQNLVAFQFAVKAGRERDDLRTILDPQLGGTIMSKKK